MRREQETLPTPKNCDACQSAHIRFAQSREIYGDRTIDPNVWGYHCLNCRAAVSTHPGTRIPMGRMADSATRALRLRAHLTFDPLWQFGRLSRDKAYRILAEALGLSEAECHIGMMNKQHLLDTIAFARSYLSDAAAIERRRKAKKDERQIKRDEREAQHAIYRRRQKPNY